MKNFVTCPGGGYEIEPGILLENVAYRLGQIKVFKSIEGTGLQLTAESRAAD